MSDEIIEEVRPAQVDTKEVEAPKKTKAKSKSKNLRSDAFFKKAMESELVAKEFLSEYLPAHVKDFVNLETIKPEKESFVEESLKRRLSDVVFSVKTKDNEDAYIYMLVEHFSSPNYWTAMKLWKYTLLLMERHQGENNKLPLIMPTVVYAGEKKFNVPRNLFDLFEHPDMARKILTENYHLVNLQEMPDDEIERKRHLSLFEYILKHIKTRDIRKLWEDIFEKFDVAIKMDEKNGFVYIKSLIWYSDTKIPEEQKKEFIQLINNKIAEGKNLMRTIADSYIDEGVEKGLVQGIEIGTKNGVVIGKQEGIEIGTKMGIEQGIEQGIEKGLTKGVHIGMERVARTMLDKNRPIEEILEFTGLSREEILKLKNK